MSIEKVSFSPEGFQRFLSVLQTRFGSAGDAILFSMAKEFGVYDSQQMLSLLNENDELVDKQTIVQMLLDSISSFNWGRYEITKFNLLTGEIIINIIDNPVLTLCDKRNTPTCFFVKGVLSGIIKVVTEIEFKPTAQVCKIEEDVCQFKFTRR